MSDQIEEATTELSDCIIEVRELRREVARLTEDRERALRLAKEATNGWACYAKRRIEHDEIARLHRSIDAMRDAARREDAATRTEEE